MKNQNSSDIKIRKLAIKTGILFILSFLLSLTFAHNSPHIKSLFQTFTTDDPDSTIETDFFEDTIVLAEGLDTIYVINIDSATMDTSDIDLREIDYAKDIIINPGGILKNNEPGLFGYHIEGMFLNSHMPDDATNLNYPTTWQWLSDLKPQVLRFPGGASSRWMHLLPYDSDNEDDIFSTGYGYEIDEIIRFYDVTNGNKLTDEVDDITIENIKEDLEDPDDVIQYTCDECFKWMDFNQYQTDFQNLYKRWAEQDEIPASQPQLYIDQFIDLIEYIQFHQEYTVDVLVDLNVVSESASQCLRIVEYLRDAGVNVVGVEMGNETNLNWAHEIMGFDIFDDYWKYINGHGDGIAEDYFDYYTEWVDEFYSYVFNATMQEDHNYIDVFKNTPGFECKVGIPAANLEDQPDATPPIYYALKTGFAYSTNWNQALATHYTDHLTIGGETIYLFDAVILHPYYNPGNNWENIALDNFATDYYPNSGFPYYNHEPCEFPPSVSLWQYGDYDERLRKPFEGILGTSTPNQFGNFKQFIKSRYMESYNQQNIDLKFFWKNKPYKKELWTTEWNLKDKKDGPDVSDFDQLLFSSYCNSFPHGLLIHEWFLKDLKTNYDPAFRQNFHTYSTFHAWGGGAPSAMLYHADKGDRTYHLDENGDPDPLPLTGPNIWLRRTLYYTFQLLSEISSQNLKYMPSTFSMDAHNPNIQPTVFFDESDNTLHIYYSNMKDETQSYVLNLGHLIDLFPGATIIGYGAANISNIDAVRPYSNSGKSSLYTINTCYNDIGFFHPFEIQGITGPTLNDPECYGLTGGAICVTVPANSYGYFSVPIYSTSKEGVTLNDNQLTLFPNPSAKSFRLECDLPEIIINEFHIEILDLNGKSISNSVVAQNEDIDISQLPSGIYMIAITNKEHSFSIIKKRIKIE